MHIVVIMIKVKIYLKGIEIVLLDNIMDIYVLRTYISMYKINVNCFIKYDKMILKLQGLRHN